MIEFSVFLQSCHETIGSCTTAVWIIMDPYVKNFTITQMIKVLLLVEKLQDLFVIIHKSESSLKSFKDKL